MVTLLKVVAAVAWCAPWVYMLAVYVTSQKEG